MHWRSIAGGLWMSMVLLLRTWRKLARCSRGASSFEYLVLAGLVALAAAVGFQTFGQSLQGAVEKDAYHVATLTGGTPQGTSGAPGAAGEATECVNGICLGGGNCFVAGTKVSTADGLRDIESVRPGDLVASQDEATGVVVFEPVRAVFSREAHALVDVRIARGDGALESLRATPEHPFRSLDRGWIGAGELRANERIVDVRSEVLEVVDVTRVPVDATVYNLEVEATHTYFAGVSQVLVHNTCGGTPPPSVATTSNVSVAAPAAASAPGATSQSPPPPAADDETDNESFITAHSSADSDTDSFHSATSNLPEDDDTVRVASSAPGATPALESDPNSPTQPIDAVFLKELSSTPMHEQAYNAWKYGGKTALTVVGLAVPGASVITSPVSAGIDTLATGARYAHAYGTLEAKLDSLHDIRASIGPEAVNDRARAVTNYAISQTTKQLTSYYDGTTNSIINNVVGQIPLVGPILSGANSARVTIGGLSHTAHKYHKGELGVERKAGARILLDEAYLNDSVPAQKVMETYYGKPGADKIGEEWRKIHAGGVRMDENLHAANTPLPESKEWANQRSFVGKWSMVRPKRVEPELPPVNRVTTAIVSRIQRPETVRWTGDPAVMDRRGGSPSGPRVKSRPIAEFPNEQIEATLGPRFKHPTNIFGKAGNAIHNAFVGMIPGKGIKGVPDKPIVEGTKGRLSSTPKPLKNPKVKQAPRLERSPTLARSSAAAAAM